MPPSPIYTSVSTISISTNHYTTSATHPTIPLPTPPSSPRATIINTATTLWPQQVAFGFISTIRLKMRLILGVASAGFTQVRVLFWVSSHKVVWIYVQCLVMFGFWVNSQQWACLDLGYNRLDYDAFGHYSRFRSIWLAVVNIG
nr:hypothetical protein [Tanacetum cinerariifolium]